MHATTFEAISPLRCPSTQEAPSDGRWKDDIGLARRIQAADQTAFRELIERYQSRIFRLGYAILHNRQDAEDIAQEAFAKVYFSIMTFDGRSSLFAWIYRIAVNECYAQLRKRRVKLVLESDAELEAVEDGRPTAERALTGRDLAKKLLSRVPEEDRVLLLWKEVEGFSVPQLAKMTGLNQNTVKTRLFRARRKLAEVAARLSRRPVAAVPSRR
jgi:RNA polymerase sigma-70 factor (ECF subfamily)